MNAYNALIHIHHLMKVPFLHPLRNGSPQTVPLDIPVKVLDNEGDKLWAICL
jgi:hypothetical protein